jgi:antitoxin (DNA-binding transcriptional repressor) of toxin-antitoxin stability system
MAICSYIACMRATGIRDLKDNLSRYVRRVEAGERIAVTAHGRVVAELGPPARDSRGTRASRYDELVATGVVRPPLESGDPLAGWPALRLPAGTVAELIDADRGET